MQAALALLPTLGVIDWVAGIGTVAILAAFALSFYRDPTCPHCGHTGRSGRKVCQNCGRVKRAD